MFTDLVNMEITEEDGEPRRLTLEQAVNFAALIGSAGTETVARMLGWAALALDNNPDQRAELVADSSLIPNAVEEVLRYEAPSPVQSRWCIERRRGARRDDPGQLEGRDDHGLSRPRTSGPTRTPTRFDIHRKFDHHLSFGYGIHFCLGRRAGPDRGADRPGGDLQALPRVVGRHGRRGPALHEHGPGLHQAADQRLTWSRAPRGPGQGSGTLFCLTQRS